MSTVVHSFILGPGDTVKVYCVDGLSSLDILKIEQIYNFGGMFKLIDCGVGYEDAVLLKARDSMFSLIRMAE